MAENVRGQKNSFGEIEKVDDKAVAGRIQNQGQPNLKDGLGNEVEERLMSDTASRPTRQEGIEGRAE
jgi:hypothetical protein